MGSKGSAPEIHGGKHRIGAQHSYISKAAELSWVFTPPTLTVPNDTEALRMVGSNCRYRAFASRNCGVAGSSLPFQGKIRADPNASPTVLTGSKRQPADAEKHAVRGRKAAPVGDPNGAKSGRSNHTKSCSYKS
jgi:hypothetical protein